MGCFFNLLTIYSKCNPDRISSEVLRCLRVIMFRKLNTSVSNSQTSQQHSQNASGSLLKLFSTVISILIVFVCTSCTKTTITVTVSHTSQPTTGGTTLTSINALFEVMISQRSFSPDTLNIQAGDTVSWVNEDDTPHSIVSMHHFQDEDDVTHIFIGEIWDSGYIEPGKSFERVFDEPGVFEYIKLPLIVRTPMEQYSAFSQVGVGVIIVE